MAASSSCSGGFSVHQYLGSGLVADTLLWRRRSRGAFLLIFSSLSWYLFERAGYNILSFCANVLLLLVVILFFWAKSASVLSRPLPSLPDLEISEESVVNVAEVVRIWINRVLLVAHDIAVERNLKLLIQVLFSLWTISYIGSLANFLTFIYMGIIFSLSVPVLYEKYQVSIDDRLSVIHNIIMKQYNRVGGRFLKKKTS